MVHNDTLCHLKVHNETQWHTRTRLCPFLQNLIHVTCLCLGLTSRDQQLWMHQVRSRYLDSPWIRPRYRHTNEMSIHPNVIRMSTTGSSVMQKAAQQKCSMHLRARMGTNGWLVSFHWHGTACGQDRGHHCNPLLHQA